MSLSVFWQFVRLRMKERMEYRAAYLLGILAQIWGYGGQYIVVWLLLRRFQTIHGWSWPQIAFLYSLDLFTYALGAAFTFSPFSELEQMVEEGTFDGVLVQPLNPYLYLVARKYNVGYAAHVILSGLILIWATTQLSFHWTALLFLYFLLILVSGVLLQAAFITFLGSLTFIVIRSQMLFGLYYSIKAAIAYPISIYGAAVQVALTVVFPLAFVNFYPATTLLSKSGQFLPGWIGWVAPLVGPLIFWLSYRIWTYGMNRYQSAGG
ncbi:multidrug ABC transporter permease [Dictyobacter sp. S3.2.2.5]|uniref:Multidrug ABC transporter permease n=1 Tax=Dictyobacter halimunensis TaxID=3026934 RepID=A0ABQ6FKD8_9CHLR|nr:multidrug ABC transporter permease [Dictyobacter sp. S3.2.2.5]